ncbi:hypothetical protein N7478_011793 [Penicillium angulare]|uniref:uncharacterized protein n=1 Tax=Penicillium angulare TaxID=116970 RepID=UPI00253FAC79|nr:uncharacterized protein N7478_011793 [Penicillium angulare]KAJ5261198.1 hypothetical protein N7478_011793 [Penicillium angulare]
MVKNRAFIASFNPMSKVSVPIRPPFSSIVEVVGAQLSTFAANFGLMRSTSIKEQLPSAEF